MMMSPGRTRSRTFLSTNSGVVAASGSRVVRLHWMAASPCAASRAKASGRQRPYGNRKSTGASGILSIAASSSPFSRARVTTSSRSSAYSAWVQAISRAMRLRGIREVTGLSPEELAATTGVSAAEVLEFESGDKEIPVSYLYEVAKACSVDLTALLTGDEAHLQAYSLVRDGQGLSVDRRKAYKYQALAYRFHKPAMTGYDLLCRQVLDKLDKNGDLPHAAK